MGIKVEFNPDLALRHISEFRAGRRAIEECIPDQLEIGKTYPFLKADQRLYWLEGELPLVETKGNQELSRPLASVVILEATHFVNQGRVCTKGFYRVEQIFSDDQPHFDGWSRLS